MEETSGLKERGRKFPSLAGKKRKEEGEEEEEEEDHRYGIRVWIHGLKPSILCTVWVWELLNSFLVGLS